MLLRKIVVSGLSFFGIACVSLSAVAGDLTIVNNTSQDSTAIINGKICTAGFPNGITYQHSTNKIAQARLLVLCLGRSCSADIYMNDKCEGNPIATVTLDVIDGIQSVVTKDSSYSLTQNGPFEIDANGGPASK